MLGIRIAGNYVFTRSEANDGTYVIEPSTHFLSYIQNKMRKALLKEMDIEDNPNFQINVKRFNFID